MVVGAENGGYDVGPGMSEYGGRKWGLQGMETVRYGGYLARRGKGGMVGWLHVGCNRGREGWEVCWPYVDSNNNSAC